jgi:hypothetical protein
MRKHNEDIKNTEGKPAEDPRNAKGTLEECVTETWGRHQEDPRNT